MSIRLLFAGSVDSDAPVGQEILLTGMTSWTVPADVTSISVVAIQGGSTGAVTASPVTVTVDSTIVCRAQNGSRIGDGGGDGGAGGSDSGIGTIVTPGGGGAGGYSGNGGNGAVSEATYDGEEFFPYLSPGNAGSGGGGGGAGSGWTPTTVVKGGGTGLLGQGTAGAAGPVGGAGGSGSAVTGTVNFYGGGAPGTGAVGGFGGRGGALAYKNNITVTPGQTVTVSIPATLTNALPAAIRIIWGTGRSFPSTNTGNL